MTENNTPERARKHGIVEPNRNVLSVSINPPTELPRKHSILKIPSRSNSDVGVEQHASDHHVKWSTKIVVEDHEVPIDNYSVRSLELANDKVAFEEIKRPWWAESRVVGTVGLLLFVGFILMTIVLAYYSVEREDVEWGE